MLCFVTLTNSLLSVALWNCKTTPRFGNSLGLTALCVCIYVHGCGLLTVEEYTVKSANEKIAWDKVWRKPGAGFQEPPPAKDMLNSCSIKVWKQGWSVYQESALETLCPVLLLGAGHVGTLFLACAQITLAERKQECSINFIACTNSWGTVGHTCHFWEWWTPPSLCSQVPPKGHSCKQSFVKGGGLRPAVYAFLHMYVCIDAV